MYYEQALGWLIELSPLALVVIASIVTVFLRLRKGQQIAFLQPGLLLKPSAEWGPRFCICLYTILCLWARNPKPSFYNNTFLASVFLHKQNLISVITTGRTGLPEQCQRARRISHSTTASTTASAMVRVLEMSPTPAAWRTVLNIVAKKKLQRVDKLLMFLPELKVLQLKMTRSSRRVKMTMETQVIAPQRREHSFEQN